MFSMSLYGGVAAGDDTMKSDGPIKLDKKNGMRETFIVWLVPFRAAHPPQ